MDQDIIDLIEPQAGPFTAVKPATGGHGVATTALVENNRGDRLFVKATPNRPGGNLNAARREATIGPHLQGVAPRFLFHTENTRWFVTVVEALDARPTDLTPGSSDLEPALEAINRITTLGLPEVAAEWHDTRWDRAATPEEIPHLRGAALTHTDLHGRNILLDGEGRGWIVDWEWPTRASPALMPTMSAVQLVSSGHTPESALTWVSKLRAWGSAPEEDRRVCAAVNARLYEQIAASQPEERWLAALSEAANAWAKHVS